MPPAANLRGAFLRARTPYGREVCVFLEHVRSFGEGQPHVDRAANGEIVATRETVWFDLAGSDPACEPLFVLGRFADVMAFVENLSWQPAPADAPPTPNVHSPPPPPGSGT